MKPAAKTTHTKTVDSYLAASPKDKRAALMKLRKTIKAAAPKATEGTRVLRLAERAGRPASEAVPLVLECELWRRAAFLRARGLRAEGRIHRGAQLGVLELDDLAVALGRG